MDHATESLSEDIQDFKKINLEYININEFVNILEKYEINTDIFDYIEIGKFIKYFAIYLNEYFIGYNLWKIYEKIYNIVFTIDIWNTISTDVNRDIWNDFVVNDYIDIDTVLQNKLALTHNVVNSFDVNDNFYLIDYIHFFKSLKLKSNGDYLSFSDQINISKNLARCCRQFITAGQKSYIIKESKTKPFVIVQTLGYDTDINTIKYHTTQRRTKIIKPFDSSIIEHLPKYNEIVCKPYHIDKPIHISVNQFNIFKPFKAKYIENPDYSKILPFINHIRFAWSNNSKELFNYIMSWLAFPLQKLTKSNVAMFMKGKQGSGKSFIFDFLHQYVYGPDTSLVVSSLDSVMSKFNASLAGKLMIYVEETGVSDKSWTKDFNKFKPQITSGTIMIEPKNKDTYPVENVSNYIITSNHDGIKIEQGDRRYLVIECKDDFLNNVEYFKNIHDNCFNQEVGDIFYTYLRNFEMVPLNPIPITDYKKELISNGIPKHELFLNTVFIDETIAFPENFFQWHIDTQKYYFQRKDLYDMYVSIHGQTIKNNIFYKCMNNIPGIIDVGRIRINGLQVHCSCVDPKYYNTIMISTHSFDAISLQNYSKNTHKI